MLRIIKSKNISNKVRTKAALKATEPTKVISELVLAYKRVLESRAIKKQWS